MLHLLSNLKIMTFIFKDTEEPIRTQKKHNIAQTAEQEQKVNF